MTKKFDPERVLVLGDADGTRLAKAPISSDVNIEEYDTIISQPATWRLEHSGGTPIEIGRWVDVVQRRLDSVRNWIIAGNDFLVVLDKVVPVAYAPIGMRDASENFDFRDMPPLEALSFKAVAGERVQFAGPAALSSFFEPWIDRLCYRNVIYHRELMPLLIVSGATKRSIQVVGGVIRYGAGNLILVPPDNSDPRSSARSNYLFGVNIPRQSRGL